MNMRPTSLLRWVAGLVAVGLTSCAHQQAGSPFWPSLTPERYGQFWTHFWQVKHLYPEPRWFNYVARFTGDNFLLRVVTQKGSQYDASANIVSVQEDGSVWASVCERPGFWSHGFTATEVRLSTTEMTRLREQLGKLDLASTPTDFSPDLTRKRAAVIFRKPVGGDIINHECIGDLPANVATILEPVMTRIGEETRKKHRAILSGE